MSDGINTEDIGFLTVHQSINGVHRLTELGIADVSYAPIEEGSDEKFLIHIGDYDQCILNVHQLMGFLDGYKMGKETT